MSDAAVIQSDAMPKHMRRVVTPEGVELRMSMAPVSSRAAAFIIDVIIILAMLVALMLVSALVASAGIDEWGATVATLGLFALRNFYFTVFELRWRGSTPGKKLMRLRVVDARGGALSASAIFVRNLTRELELFLPLVILIQPDLLWPGAPYIAQFFAASWTLLLLLMPFLNRDRLRVGDLMAGTMVIRQPRNTLYEDVGSSYGWQQRTRVYEFSATQLDMYGIYELQVLESFIRQYPTQAAMGAVAEKIATKIGWGDRSWEGDPRQFLHDFYESLRSRREQRMLFGDKQQSKKEGRLEAPGQNRSSSLAGAAPTPTGTRGPRAEDVAAGGGGKTVAPPSTLAPPPAAVSEAPTTRASGEAEQAPQQTLTSPVDHGVE